MTPVDIGDTQGTLQAQKTFETLYKCPETLVWVYISTQQHNQILGSESLARWLVSLVLALDIEHYRITASVNHLTCPLPAHQSVIWLTHCHHISQLFDLPTATTSSVRASARDRASARHRALPYHCINHLTCPLPPHQSVIWLSHCQHIISQS